MEGIHNLKAEKVIRAFEKAGWTVRGQTGSHVVLKKEDIPAYSRSRFIRASL